MKMENYLKQLFEAYNEGRISEDAYDAGLMNASNFCDEEEEDECTM